MDVIVEGKKYVVHTEHLTTVSAYFSNAFDGLFAEAKDHSITLAPVKASTFDVFIEWIYSRQLVRSSGAPGFKQSRPGGKPRREERKDDAAHIADLIAMRSELLSTYIFADIYDVPQLRRDTLEAFQSLCSAREHTQGAASLIERAYKDLPRTSPMIRFLVDIFAFAWDASGLDEQSKYPQEFLTVVLQKVLSSPNRTPPKNPLRHRCDYHEHKKNMDK